MIISHALRLFSLSVVVVFLLSAQLFAQDGSKLLRAKDPVPNSYIVVLEDSADMFRDLLPAQNREDHIARTAGSLASRYGGTVDLVYSTAVKGFSVKISPKQAEELSRDPGVKYVEEDFYMSGSQTTQTSPTWGIDRIDDRMGPDGTYTYTTTGTGVHAYVIDSGIRLTHTEFGGRATFGADFVNDGQNGNDCNGHGTHVAGTLGGATYGVAKNVSLHNVRVLGCDNRGTGSAILGGIDWVRNNRVLPAVVNFSIGMDGISITVENAIANSIANGINYSISAGNLNVDACTQSPGGRVPTAFSVAASDTTDERAAFSNYGPCIDIFAPGTSIRSAWYTGDTANVLAQGTSMASPHVAGVIARLLESFPLATPAEIKSSILNSATPERIRSAGTGSTKSILYSNVVFNGPPPISFGENSTPSQYPAEKTISGIDGPISVNPGSVQVRINEFTHNTTSAISFLLVGPTGAAILLQSGAGHTNYANGITYTISDAGTFRFSESAMVDGRVYQPSRVYNLVDFPAPGPGTVYNDPGTQFQAQATLSSTFAGTDPNGVWKLYIRSGGQSIAQLGGSITSWDLIITNPPPPPTPTPSPTIPPVDTSATFVELDSTTKGNWVNKYGSEAYLPFGQPYSVPSSVQVTFPAGVVPEWWSDQTMDERALQLFHLDDRRAMRIRNATSTEVQIYLPDEQQHRLAVYNLDWERLGRQQTIEIIDASTGQVLDTRSMTAFGEGVYAVWIVKGRFKVRFTNNGGAGTDAVYSGLFIDPLVPPPPPTPTPTPTTVYDIVGGFSSASNSGSPWMYGQGAAQNGEWTAFTGSGEPWTGIRTWSPTEGGACCAMVAKNISGTTQNYPLASSSVDHRPEFLYLQNGPNGQRATVRWIAPASGTYEFRGRFHAIHNAFGSIDVSIFHNSSRILNRHLSLPGNYGAYWFSRTVNANDQIDFVIWSGIPGSTYQYSGAGLLGTISTWDATPTPTPTPTPAPTPTPTPTPTVTPSPTPAPVDSTPYDFDGDGKADQAVFRPAEGVWYLLQSRDSALGYGFGLAGDQLTAADFDGDGKTDPAIYREGVWWVLNSNGTGHNAIQWGIASDIPVAADYDGDGKADRSVYRDGTWWILFSSGAGYTTINWGIAGDKPVPADYDGDGKADFAVYRNGEWWILFANGSGYNMVQSGQAGDIPVPADYDGDGRADIAFYRQGEWSILNSMGQTSTTQWGETGDQPVPADYDGDGKTDISIYRNGDWWTLLPTGYTNNTWGIPNDIPVPMRY